MTDLLTRSLSASSEPLQSTLRKACLSSSSSGRPERSAAPSGSCFICSLNCPSWWGDLRSAKGETTSAVVGSRTLFLKESGDGRCTVLQGGTVLLREGVDLLALDVDRADDLPSRPVKDRN